MFKDLWNVYKAIHQKMNRKWKIASLENFYGKKCVGFCLNTGKRLIIEVSF